MSKLTLSRGMEHALDRYEVAKMVADELQKKSIVLPDAPQWGGEIYGGQLPSNLADFSDHDISKIITVVTQWKNFLRGQLAVYKGSRDACKVQLKVVRAYLRKQFREEPEAAVGATADAKKWTMDDRLEMHDTYQEVQRNGLYFTNLVEILHAAYDAGESDYNAVSRVITLRGQDREGSRRGRADGGGRRWNRDDL